MSQTINSATQHPATNILSNLITEKIRHQQFPSRLQDVRILTLDIRKQSRMKDYQDTYVKYAESCPASAFGELQLRVFDYEQQPIKTQQ